MPKREKTPQYVLPAGEAVYPWINKPDDRPINGSPQKPAFKLNVRYPANSPAWLKAKEQIDALVEESYDAAVSDNPKKKKVIQRAYPYQMEMDEEGEETGNVVMRLKQSAFIKTKKGETIEVSIPKFTASGRPLSNSVNVYSGSTVIASFSVRPYFMQLTGQTLAGISVDLKAVQVLELVTSSGGRSASSYGFGAVEGYSDPEPGGEEDDVETSDEVTSEDDETDPTKF